MAAADAVSPPGSPAGVSFVINVFGKAATLEPVLGALFAQTGDYAREFLFLDSHPKGEAAARLKLLTAGRSNVVIHRHADAGPANAANLGARMARFEHLRFVDGDDLLAAGSTVFLQRGLKETGAAVAISSGAYFPSFEAMVFDEAALAAHRWETLNAALWQVMRHTISNMSGTMYRREAFLEVGGCDERVFIHDLTPVLRIAKRFDVAVTEAVSWGGLSEDQSRIMTGSRNQLFHDYNAALYYFLLDNPDLEARYRRLAFNRAAGRASKWARREEKRSAWKFRMLEALSYLPGNPAYPAWVGATRAAFGLSRKLRV
jgi:glycosyltransferase involved in cell wall biosynthesis